MSTTRCCGDKAEEANHYLICNVCGHDDFSPTLTLRNMCVNVVERSISGDLSTENVIIVDNCQTKRPDLDELKATYSRLKIICTLDSWYVQEAGEALAQSYLDRVENAESESEQRGLCSYALDTLRELEQHKVDDICCPLPSLLRQYKIAKLQLFLCHDPRPAMAMLKDIQTKLIQYYPQSHELIQDLEACMDGLM